MQRSLLALGLLAALAVPAAAYEQSPRITNPAIVEFGGQRADPGVDATTTQSIAPSREHRQVNPDASVDRPDNDQSTLFGANR